MTRTAASTPPVQPFRVEEPRYEIPGGLSRSSRAASRTSIAMMGGSADPTFVHTNSLIQAQLT